MIGTTISHYKILEKLGEGGMGVVYKAQDLKLDRIVALKFLPPHLALAEDDKNRFIHEAKAASALDHPNICNVHEIDETDNGLFFIAMTFYEGIPLSKRIEGGPLKIQEVLDVAVQIADGLQAAHKKEIIHRDIKSSNILLTNEGRAVIMDFGLARRRAASMLTKTGTMLGTAPYMSPEQAQGITVDHRTDVWSLGVVLYEMITGLLPFRSDYQGAIVYSILNEQPEPITGLRSNVPMDLERIIRKCLEKDPGRRYQHIEELAVDVRNLKNEGLTSTTSRRKRVLSTFRMKFRRNVALTVLAWLMAFVFFVLLLLGRLKENYEAPHRIFTLDFPEASPVAFVGDSPLGIGFPSFSLSPNGSKLVYVARKGMTTELRIRNLNSLETLSLPGTDGSYHPVFSPSGDWIAFFSGDELKKIAAFGGPAVVLTKVTEPFGLAWLTEEQLLVANVQGSNFSWVPASGGSLAILLRQSGRGPHVLPANQSIVFRGEDRELHLFSFETKKHLVLSQQGFVPIESAKEGEVIRGSNPFYLFKGYLSYFPSGGNGLMMAIEFDPSAPEKPATAFPFLEHVRQEGEVGFGQIAASKDGLLIYAPGENAGLTRFVRVRRSGETDTLPFPRADYGQFRISPDGTRILVMTWPEGGKKELSILDLSRRERVRLFADFLGNYFDWWPDGKSIVYTNRPKKESQELLVVRQNVSDSQPRDTLVKGTFSAREVSLNGSIISLVHRGKVAVFSFQTGEARILVEDSTTLFPTPSPDGQWMAYTSRMSGQSEIWIANVNSPGERHKVSIDGGEEPVWSKAGDELIYRKMDKWMAMSISNRKGFSAHKPRLLFRGSFRNVPGWSHDVFPDGSHLVLAGPNKSSGVRLNVVTNYFELLEQLSKGRQK